jgi:putative endonuclease
LTDALPPISRDRRKAERRGHFAELLAAAYLRLRGYRILARRHKTRSGEIDLIASRGDVVAFIEVKARAGENLAVDAVSFAAQRRIRNAADQWIAREHRRGRDVSRFSFRFDIVAILPGRWPRHYPDAF